MLWPMAFPSSPEERSGDQKAAASQGFHAAFARDKDGRHQEMSYNHTLFTTS